MVVLSIGRLLQPFSPYRIIASYTVFFVVRAKGDLMDLVDNEVIGPTGVFLQENTLAGGLRHTLEQLAENSMHRDVPPHSDTFLNTSVPNISKGVTISKSEFNLIQMDPVQNNSENAILDGKFPQMDIFSFLPVFAPTSSKVRTEDCRRHSQIFLHQLKKYKLWALQRVELNTTSALDNYATNAVYDSSAKLPSGILRGNTNQFGDFDQCLSVKGSDPSTPKDLIRGQYCLASIDISATPHAASGKDSLETPSGHILPQFSTIKWGLCVPHSCTPDDVDATLKDALEPFSTSLMGIQIQTRVEPDMCYVDQPTEFGVGTYVIISVYSAVIAVALIATLRDNKNAAELKSSGKLEKMLMAFSIKKTLPELLSVKRGDGNIQCIHGIRTVCTVALYVLHKYMALLFIPYSNRIYFTQISQQSLSMMLRAFINYVHSFLLLSGVLTAYNTCQEIKRNGCIDWKKRYLARFIRLTPALMSLVVFYAYIWEHLGNGPLWNKVVKRNADLCKVSMWRNMLYVQNFYPFEEMCATHTHQLALDMQLSLVAPPIVYLLFLSQGWGILLLATLQMISVAIRYYVSVQDKLSPLLYNGITLYLVYGGWLSAVYLIYLSFFSMSEVVSPEYQYDAVEIAFYYALSPVALSLALCWVILACATRNGGWLKYALCWRGLTIFSKISYSVYLTQFLGFFYNVGTTRTSQEFTAFTSVAAAGGLVNSKKKAIGFSQTGRYGLESFSIVRPSSRVFINESSHC
uniref:Nose resistant-to-fluoxetine protein N-terminal domain-containing protein n=1 Tax=Timema shepardi TaxID=629360 RepID=A0A7R9ALH4_TIMSH|nr:unnamed protein product [Timema shepardi]